MPLHNGFPLSAQSVQSGQSAQSAQSAQSVLRPLRLPYATLTPTLLTLPPVILTPLTILTPSLTPPLRFPYAYTSYATTYDSYATYDPYATLTPTLRYPYISVFTHEFVCGYIKRLAY